VRAVPVVGGVRSNITLAEPDGTTTKLNELGPDLSDAEQKALLDAVLSVSGPGVWVVGSGSLPGGVPDRFYADLVAPVRATGARVVIDTSGAAMAAVLEAPNGALPDLVKPNREELAEAVGRRMRTLGDVVEAAGELRERGIDTVLASLGADGAVLVTATEALHGEARIAAKVSTVGAGDAALAGYLFRAVDGAPPRECLSAALGWGSAATALPGSRMPAPDEVAAIAVTVNHRLDRNRLLEGER
jgi:1-phosphofructokinase family hexose kinase